MKCITFSDVQFWHKEMGYRTELNISLQMGKTLLHHCANSGDKMNVEILLKRGAPPNKVDKVCNIGIKTGKIEILTD